MGDIDEDRSQPPGTGCLPSESAPTYEQVYAFAALRKAFSRARRGKRGSEPEARFYFHLENELLRLSDELTTRRYQPAPYRFFRIRRPKPRLISVATFRDRVVHHALVAALEPVFEPTLYRHSYACRRSKGTHRAIWWAQHFTRRYAYHLKCDVRHYFENVDHQVLLELLARHISDAGILWLCRRILDNARLPTVPAGRRRGIPIGNLTSQFWGNVYLDPADRLLHRHSGVGAHLRYMDDLLLFGRSKAALWEVLAELRGLLRSRLRLSLKDEATVVAPVTEGISYLGYRVFPIWSDSTVVVSFVSPDRCGHDCKNWSTTARTTNRRRHLCLACSPMPPMPTPFDSARGFLPGLTRSQHPRDSRLLGEGHSDSKRVNRGGSWNNDASNLRSANRNRNTPSNRNNNLGARCLSSRPARKAVSTDAASVHKVMTMGLFPAPAMPDEEPLPIRRGRPSPALPGRTQLPAPGVFPAQSSGLLLSISGHAVWDRTVERAG